MRNAFLDVLRGVAVLLVTVGHLPFGLDPHAFHPWIRHVFFRILPGSWIGVDLFFVLSGFLVSGLLFEEYTKRGTVRLGRFFVRRGLKLYPGFYTLLLATLLVKLILKADLHGAAFLHECLFLQNYGPVLWPHTWSPAVEQHSYILIGALLYFSAHPSDGGRPFRIVPWAFAAATVTCLVFRESLAHRIPYVSGQFIYPTHMRFDALMYGVMLSYIYHFHREPFLRFARKWTRPLVAVGILLALPPFKWGLGEISFTHTLGLTCLSLGGVCLVTWAATRDRRPNRVERVLAWVGFYSYSIYLWHVPVIVWGGLAVKHMGLRWPADVIGGAMLVGSCLVGFIMARLVEIPALAIRDRLWPARGAAT